MQISDYTNTPIHRQLRALSPRCVTTPLGLVEYCEYGEGPVVLAAHGAMGGYDQSWLLTQTIGTAGYRYICVSRPGYLGTPLKPNAHPDRQADLCAALLDALQIERAVFMAVSGGGYSALHFALRHPARCNGLVLVSTCGDVMDTPIPLSFRLTKWMMYVPAVACRLSQKLTADLDLAASRSITDSDLRRRTLADPETGALFTALLVSTWDHVERRMRGTENDIRVTRRTSYPLEQICTPALIIHGKRDPMAPYEPHARLLHSRIANSRLVTVEEGEHAAIFTHREYIQPQVCQFLRETAYA